MILVYKQNFRNDFLVPSLMRRCTVSDNGNPLKPPWMDHTCYKGEMWDNSYKDFIVELEGCVVYKREIFRRLIDYETIHNEVIGGNLDMNLRKSTSLPTAFISYYFFAQDSSSILYFFQNFTTLFFLGTVGKTQQNFSYFWIGHATINRR